MQKKKKKKKFKKEFCFSDNSIWITSVKLSLLTSEYLSSAVNVVTDSLKILHTTNRNFFLLNCLDNDQ